MPRPLGPIVVLVSLMFACGPTEEPEPEATSVASTGAADDGGATQMGDATGDDGGPTDDDGPEQTEGTTGPDPADSGDTGLTDDTTAGDDADGTTTAVAEEGQVVMETTLGTIVIELYPDESPVTVANFLAYVEAGFYDGTDGLSPTVMHRVIPGFVIQGGGLTAELANKATMPPIVNEFGNGPTNLRGTLSMARTNDPDSATSQFFVNVVDNGGLDTPPGYAVFGEVVQGMDVVDAIVAVETTTSGPYSDVPVRPVVITSVTVQ